MPYSSVSLEGSLGLVFPPDTSIYELNRRLKGLCSRGLSWLGYAGRFVGRHIVWQLARLSASLTRHMEGYQQLR